MRSALLAIMLCVFREHVVFFTAKAADDKKLLFHNSLSFLSVVRFSRIFALWNRLVLLPDFPSDCRHCFAVVAGREPTFVGVLPRLAGG